MPVLQWVHIPEGTAYGDGANPVILKSEFIMSLCEQLIGGTNLGAKQKSIIDRCTASVYRSYQQNDYQGHIPTLQDFRAELLQQDEPEAKELALAIELFTHGSLNTFARGLLEIRAVTLVVLRVWGYTLFRKWQLTCLSRWS